MSNKRLIIDQSGERSIKGAQKGQRINHFKQTEIGLIPKDWEVARLENVCKITTGKKDVNQGNPNGIYPFFSCSRKINYSDTYSFDTEAILVAGNGDVGLTKYYKGKFEAYQRTYVLYDFKKEVKFIFYYILFGLKKKLIKDKSGSTMPYVRKGDLSSFQIPIPPYSEEQQKIARVLSKIQEAIEQQNKIIEAAKNLKKSLMDKLFTEGLGHTEFKETEIGQIPASWEVVRMGEDDILSLTQYGLSVRGGQEGKYPILRMNNLVNGYVCPYPLQFVNIDQKRTFTKFRLEKGDVLFNRTNSIDLVGKTSIFTLDADFVFASYLIRLKTNQEKLNPYFLNYYLNWNISQIRLKALASRGVSQANISATRLKTLKIPFLQISEQKEIAYILSTIDKKIETEEKRKVMLKELFKTMLHKLMTGEIRLKDVQV